MAIQIARVVGGAGTGKTSRMISILCAAMERPEVDRNPLALGFSSFTRAARLTASTRAAERWGVERSDLERHGWFKTAHAVAHKVLEIKPGEIIGNSPDDQKFICDAIDAQVSYTFDEDEGVLVYGGDDKEAAACLRCWDLARATLEPLSRVVEARWGEIESLPAVDAVVSRIQRFERHKRIHARIDFTDMLSRFVGVTQDPEHGPRWVAPEGVVPNHVVGWIFDEAQDCSALTDMACRRLLEGESVRWAWTVGDPFQTIYRWAGATSKHFMSWCAAKQEVMPQSYRCPPPIMALGERCLATCSDYWDRGIAPASHEGSVTEADDIEECLAELDPSVDTLVLTRTNYYSKVLAAILKKHAVPFRPVKRQREGPLVADVAREGLWDLQHGQPTSGAAWGYIMQELPGRRRDLLRHGSQAAWKRRDGAIDQVTMSMLPELGATDQLMSIISSGDWSTLLNGGDRWMTAAKRWGAELASRPKIRLGTIHSVKGDEAEKVVVLSSLGKKSYMAARNDVEVNDEECRVKYVAVTRAKRQLILAHDRRERYRMEFDV